ncbi:hypothetical protein O9992_16625 [Vibrio lentus]|nr:hypothetical protein [Vibrio lentus]
MLLVNLDILSYFTCIRITSPTIAMSDGSSAQVNGDDHFTCCAIICRHGGNFSEQPSSSKY